MSSAESEPSGPQPFEERKAAIDATRLGQFLEFLFQRFGHDFRDYAYSSMRRRIARCIEAERLKDIEELERRMLVDATLVERIMPLITVHVTSMFRDPGFYRTLRERVLPVWQTYPFIRIWVAGCSTGEEVYSLAILLSEERLYHRCRIYATDVSERMLERARAGVFPLSSMQAYTRAYHEAGGRAEFSDYYTAREQSVVFRSALRENALFAQHNLVGDTSFNEFHGIICRNVMIYFNRDLQARVHQLFYDSLMTFGYLGLGRSESVRTSPHESDYELVSAPERVFRKIR